MTWTARHPGTCPGCKGPIVPERDPVDWAADGTHVIHARPFCRAQTAPPAVCPVHGLTLPATGVCDDCA